MTKWQKFKLSNITDMAKILTNPPVESWSHCYEKVMEMWGAQISTIFLALIIWIFPPCQKSMPDARCLNLDVCLTPPIWVTQIRYSPVYVVWSLFVSPRRRSLHSANHSTRHKQGGSELVAGNPSLGSRSLPISWIDRDASFIYVFWIEAVEAEYYVVHARCRWIRNK